MSRRRKKYNEEEVFTYRKSYVKNINPRSEKQQEYLTNLNNYPLVFAVGSAGTGKTFLAVVKALEELDANRIERIVLVRPAVTTEKFGYLPGTLEEKIDPYMKPIYDAFIDRVGVDYLDKLMQTGKIELCPLAFMRGRTLSNCFILLDEAQNTTMDQMKMFLTRFGENVKVVVTGDIYQSDLSGENGLDWALLKLRKCPSVSITRFNNGDVVRSELARQILEYI